MDKKVSGKTENLTLTKAKAFARRIVKLYVYLSDRKHERVMSKQVLRSGTSIGANLTEARYAQSTPDFTSKLGIALKEAAETVYWLELLRDGGLLTEKMSESVLADANELVAMLVTALKKLR